MAARSLLRRCGAAAAESFGSSRAAVAEKGAGAQLRSSPASALLLPFGAQRQSAATPPPTITSSSLSSWEMLRSRGSGSRNGCCPCGGGGSQEVKSLSAVSRSWLMGWVLGEGVESRSFPVAALSSSYLMVGSCHYHTAPQLNLDFVTKSSILGSHHRVSNSSGFPGSVQQTRSLSKLKSYKMKPYSSYKERFKAMADGTFKRWRSGTRHNAKSKTPKQRRQLRRPSIAPPALAKIMKKLNFIR